MEKEKVQEFLKELTKLTIKYGIAIGGCGCCGSPYLNETNKKGNYEVSHSINEYEDLAFKEKESLTQTTI